MSSETVPNRVKIDLPENAYADIQRAALIEKKPMKAFIEQAAHRRALTVLEAINQPVKEDKQASSTPATTATPTPEIPKAPEPPKAAPEKHPCYHFSPHVPQNLQGAGVVGYCKKQSKGCRFGKGIAKNCNLFQDSKVGASRPVPGS